MEKFFVPINRVILLLVITVGTVIASLYVNLIIGWEIVYTHLFYLPIILTGFWYHRKALYLALLLGLFHIGLNYFIEGAIIFSTVLRSLTFCIIALVIGFLSEKKDQYWASYQRAQESLYRSEERFRRLAENAPDIIYEIQLSPKMHYSYVSQAVTAITGYKPEDFYKDHNFIRKIIHPDDVANYNKLINGELSTSESILTRWFHKDGRIIWMEIKGTSIFDSNQKLMAMEGLVRDTTARVKMEEELKVKYKEIKIMSGRLLNAYEEERTRLARELHDEIGQTLTVISMDLQYLHLKVAKDTPSLQAKLNESISLLEKTLNNVRRYIIALRPPALDNMGLLEVIHDMVHELETRSDLEIDIHAPGFPRRLPSEIETAIYRCVQEALTNTIRHAGATKVGIDFMCSKDKIVASVEDNGKGFDPEVTTRQTKGVGLAGIRERVNLLSGSLHINAAPGEGTKISIILPLESKNEIYPVNEN